jgi:hypothetical protein
MYEFYSSRMPLHLVSGDLEVLQYTVSCLHSTKYTLYVTNITIIIIYETHTLNYNIDFKINGL